MSRLIRGGEDPGHPVGTIRVFFPRIGPFGLTGSITGIFSARERIEEQIIRDDGIPPQISQRKKSVVRHAIHDRVMIKKKVLDPCCPGTRVGKIVVPNHAVLEVDKGVIHQDERITGRFTKIEAFACAQVGCAQCAHVGEDRVRDLDFHGCISRANMLAGDLREQAAVDDNRGARRVGIDDAALNIIEVRIDRLKVSCDHDVLHVQIAASQLKQIPGGAGWSRAASRRVQHDDGTPARAVIGTQAERLTGCHIEDRGRQVGTPPL